jgi:hypothetical protein
LRRLKWNSLRWCGWVKTDGERRRGEQNQIQGGEGYQALERKCGGRTESCRLEFEDQVNQHGL